MATYYNGNIENGNNSEIIQGGSDGGDGLQTLILMNPTAPYHSHSHLGSFSDTGQLQNHHQNNNNNNFVFLNSLAPRATPQASMQQHLVGIPLDPHRSSHQEISALHHVMPRLNYNMYPTDPSSVTQGGLSLSLSRASTSSPSSEVARKINGGVLLGSRYLRAAQELLDEVVSVGREVVKGNYKMAGEGGSGEGETSGKREGEEISTAERQEVQMRKAKLIGMLDEVEQRYRQYHHQMQIVISWFEQATGIGSAKTYTALALETISKQFRCLKDAITSQIRASNKSLGEEGSFGVGKSEGSRLKYVDHQIKQQKALQQLGMIQPNAWRPQRGLPERSVSVLRAWLFEHFLHPYPKDSDKIMLAKQTGLTRSQVSNWFINARVRLWKPMVEEMYMEEVKENENNGSDDKTNKSENNNEDSTSKVNSRGEKTPAAENENMNFMSIPHIATKQNSSSMISASSPPKGVNTRSPAGFTLIGSPDMTAISQASPKKHRSTQFLQSPHSYLSNEQISMKFGEERQNVESFALMGSPTNFIGGYAGYPVGEIRRFGAEQFPTTYSGNGVSLTLGLPHCENISLSGTHQNFLQDQNVQMGRRLEIGEPDDFVPINTSNPSYSSVDYESINTQNPKRFAAHLLPDFVT